MMPTFPRSPLSFRTAGFSQYRWEAGFSSGGFLGVQRRYPAPGPRAPTSTLAFAMDQRARHSRCSRNPFRAGHVFGATLVRNCYGLSGCWPPSTDLTGLPANGGFYFQAFSGSVALPAAGYDYNSVWTPLLAGLSPAGMAASLAALVRPGRARGFGELGVSGLASMYPVSDWSC